MKGATLRACPCDIWAGMLHPFAEHHLYHHSITKVSNLHELCGILKIVFHNNTVSQFMELSKIKQALCIVTVVAFNTLASLAQATTVSDNFSHTPNAAISGYNTKPSVKGSVQACAKACREELDFVCQSFDYNKQSESCDLSNKKASDVGGLKTTYPGNPYDYYERIFISKSTRYSSKNVLAADTPLYVKQCIYNKSGFILEATWYKTKDITVKKTGKSIKVSLKRGAKPFQVDVFPTLQGRCVEGYHEPLYLAMRVKGGAVLAHLSTRVFKGLAKIGGYGYCLGVSDNECKSYGETVNKVSIKDLPGAINSFYFDQPSTKRYVDIWGTAFSPQTGLGGNI